MNPTQPRRAWRSFLQAACLSASLLLAMPGHGQDAGLPGIEIGLSAPAAAPAKVAKLTATIVPEVKVIGQGKAFRVAVKIVHAPDNHSYGKKLPADGTGQATRLEWTLPAGWTAEDLEWPDPHEAKSTGGTTSLGYDGTVYLPAKITPAAGASGEVELKLKVHALVCDLTTCMPFKTETSLRVPAGAAEELDTTPAVVEVFAKIPAPPAPVPVPKSEPEKGFAYYLMFAFIGGLILNIMPCVFPVLGIKILGVVQQAGGAKSKIVLHALAYTLGVLICFWALGGLVIALGKGWGFQLQDPRFVYGLAVFFLIFSLNMAGVFEIGASAVGVGADLQAQEGVKGSFFSGLLATVVATPCSAPFLGTALGYTVTLPAFQAMIMFSTIGLGLASPFLVLSVFPKMLAALPRPGAWMESFKQGMSFLLFGTVLFLVWVLTGMVEGQPMLFLLLSMVAVAAGCWVYGRWCLPHKSSATKAKALIVALLLAAGGVWAGWPALEEKPLDTASHTEGGLVWEGWTPEKVKELRAAGKAVYVDYTAKWCATCQLNKRVYKDEAVKALIKEKGIVLLKADWTLPNETLRLSLLEHGKAAVPFNLLYLPGTDAPIAMPELLTVENVSAAFKQIQ